MDATLLSCLLLGVSSNLYGLALQMFGDPENLQKMVGR
jgi:hypothetical protein